MQFMQGLVFAVAVIAIVLAGATSVVYYQQVAQMPPGAQDIVFALTHQRLPAMCLAPSPATIIAPSNGSER